MPVPSAAVRRRPTPWKRCEYNEWDGVIAMDERYFSCGTASVSYTILTDADMYETMLHVLARSDADLTLS